MIEHVVQELTRDGHKLATPGATLEDAPTETATPAPSGLFSRLSPSVQPTSASRGLARELDGRLPATSIPSSAGAPVTPPAAACTVAEAPDALEDPVTTFPLSGLSSPRLSFPSTVPPFEQPMESSAPPAELPDAEETYFATPATLDWDDSAAAELAANATTELSTPPDAEPGESLFRSQLRN